MSDFEFSNIVVGIDGRAGGADALTLAGALARAADARLSLVCAYLSDPVGTRLVPGEAKELRAKAVAYLEAARADADDLVDEVHPVPTSSPARGLHEVAEELGASLIVVGSSHRGPVGRVLPGSVTQQVLHGAPCAVAVAPAGLSARGVARLRRIGCGYDGGKESRAALELAKDIVRLLDGTLEVVDVVAPASPFPVYPGAMVLPEAMEDVEEAVRAELDDAVAATGELSAVGVLPTGDPAEQLVLRSESLDMLVMGSRAYGPVRRVLLGTVAGRVVREAFCPVVVVPRGVPVESRISSLAQSTRTSATSPASSTT